jgi:hypothetical protein
MWRMMCKDEARVKLDFARHLEAESRKLVSPGFQRQSSHRRQRPAAPQYPE